MQAMRFTIDLIKPLEDHLEYYPSVRARAKAVVHAAPTRIDAAIIMSTFTNRLQLK